MVAVVVGGGREGGKEGGRSVAAAEKRKYFFFLSCSLQSVRELKGGVWRQGGSLDTVKKFVCLLDILFLSWLCTQGRVGL